LSSNWSHQNFSIGPSEIVQSDKNKISLISLQPVEKFRSKYQKPQQVFISAFHQCLITILCSLCY